MNLFRKVKSMEKSHISAGFCLSGVYREGGTGKDYKIVAKENIIFVVYGNN